MTYDQAAALATEGKTVMRPHWHWCGVSSRPPKAKGKGKASPASAGRVLVLVDDAGCAGDPYRPTPADLAATDWLQA